MKLIRCLLSNVYTTCFGHHYAHHQKNKTVYCRVWFYALVVLAVVVCSCVMSCAHCVKVTGRHRISCILLVSLSSTYFHDARSQETKTCLWTVWAALLLDIRTYLARCHIGMQHSSHTSQQFLATAVSLPHSTLLCVMHRAKLSETKGMARNRTWLGNDSWHSVSSTESYDERKREIVVKQTGCGTVSIRDAICLRRP